jgi:hypothetical protein
MEQSVAELDSPQKHKGKFCLISELLVLCEYLQFSPKFQFSEISVHLPVPRRGGMPTASSMSRGTTETGKKKLHSNISFWFISLG